LPRDLGTLDKLALPQLYLGTFDFYPASKKVAAL
jgi:hypothetical protein